MKNSNLFLILAGIALAMAAPAMGATPINSCADANIFAGGTYVLKVDLPCGITIHRSNVTVQLNGHILTGPGQGIYVDNDSNHVMIEGPGLVRDFEAGFTALSWQYCQVRSVTFAQNGIGINLQSVQFATIESNLVVANGVGVSVSGVGNSSFSFNEVSGNTTSGMSFTLAGEIKVNNNILSANGGSGLIFSNFKAASFAKTRVYSNTLNGNAGSGIRLVVPPNDSDNKFFNNSAKGNKVFDVETVDACVRIAWTDNTFFTANQTCIR